MDNFGKQFGLSAYKTAKNMGNTKSLGKCALAVGDALARVLGEGIACRFRGNAFTWLPKLKGQLGQKYWKFLKQSKNTTGLPAGSIVLWDRQPAHPFGHIEVADGNGHLCSDFIRSDKLALYYNNPANITPMIFVPIESDNKPTIKGELPYDVIVTADVLNVRETASTSANIIKTLSKGTRVKIWGIKTDNDKKWGKLSKGYICLSLNNKTYAKRIDS